jgi:3-dehydroquinate synthase
MKTIPVSTGRPYEVLIGRGLLDEAGALTAQVHAPCRAVLIADSTVAELYLERVRRSYSAAGFTVTDYVFPAGENSKSMEELACLLDALALRELGRGDLLVALGGGVTGDLVGFAAACFQRGIAFVQLPTTLLAAVDSSVGGKTAVNLPAGKNLAGAFWQPRLVVCDCDVLNTLPREELSAGGAECVKYAMLWDPDLLSLLTEQGLAAPWEEVIASCVRLKAKVVEEDEQEHGVRTFLNFGHTVGHAIEALSHYQIRHGEAVAMGMMILTRASVVQELCAPEVLLRLEAALSALALATRCPYEAKELAGAALRDKKRQGESITLVLPRNIGECYLEKTATAQLERWIGLGLEEQDANTL